MNARGLRARIATAGALCAIGLAAGCGGHDPAATADRVTRAVYANDLDTATADFDEATKKEVSRGDLGSISDVMHGLGDYKSLTQRAADPKTGRYQFDASFSKGSMLVELRVDSDGKVAAYRVAPEGTPTAAAPAGSNG